MQYRCMCVYSEFELLVWAVREDARANDRLSSARGRTRALLTVWAVRGDARAVCRTRLHSPTTAIQLIKSVYVCVCVCVRACAN